MKKTTTERIPTPEEVQKFEAECLEIEAYLKRKADAKAATINSTPTAEGIRAGMIGDKCNIQTDSEAWRRAGGSIESTHSAPSVKPCYSCDTKSITNGSSISPFRVATNAW